ncbi:right-handed parallel beta-helix repeat-containing protein [bacterium]|nr:right-handed parallel beta-helix repeat-containing protein [bacterium]
MKSLGFFSASLCILSIFCCSGLCDTLTVPADYTTIQEAIDAAVSGDTVAVSPGTYTENLNFNGKAIELIGLQGYTATIIDGNNSGSVISLTNEEALGTLIEGFTIQNGNASYGGGILCTNQASPMISKCLIANNFSETSGGGVYCSSFIKILDCILTENSASAGYGGAVYFYSAEPSTLLRCRFQDNSASYGAAVGCNGSSPQIKNCEFIQNYAAMYAGAIYLDSSSSAVVTSCFISQNTVDQHHGGAIRASNDSNAEFINCIIVNNDAAVNRTGGGMSLYNCDVTIQSCTIANNSAENGYGGGISATNVDLAITDSIIWGNTPDQIDLTGGTDSIIFCCIEGGWGVPGDFNISTDPLFVTGALGNYYLDNTTMKASDCINSGSTLSQLICLPSDGSVCLNMLTTRIDDIQDILQVDRGAHYYRCLHTGDVNDDGTISAGDAQMAFWITLGYLDPWPIARCRADCNGNGSVSAADAQAIFVAVLFSGSCSDPL